MAGRRLWQAACLVMGGCCTAALAYEVQHVKVARDGEHYKLNMQVLLDADAEAAFRTMQDVNNLPQINPSVIKVLPLHTASSGEDVYTQVHLCIAFVCRTLAQVQNMTHSSSEAGYLLQAIVDPERSNLKSGRARWHFSDCGEQQTCLAFEAELVPDFWVPPLLGPWLIQRSMKQEALVSSAGLERLTQESARP